MDGIKIFSGRSNPVLAEKIAQEIGEPLGEREIVNFSDGEIWVKYSDNIRGADVFHHNRAPVPRLKTLWSC